MTSRHGLSRKTEFPTDVPSATKAKREIVPQIKFFQTFAWFGVCDEPGLGSRKDVLLYDWRGAELRTDFKVKQVGNLENFI